MIGLTLVQKYNWAGDLLTLLQQRQRVHHYSNNLHSLAKSHLVCQNIAIEAICIATIAFRHETDSKALVWQKVSKHAFKMEPKLVFQENRCDIVQAIGEVLRVEVYEDLPIRLCYIHIQQGLIVNVREGPPSILRRF
jgi:hypothetical protein